MGGEVVDVRIQILVSMFFFLRKKIEISLPYNHYISIVVKQELQEKEIRKKKPKRKKDNANQRKELQ